jgi:lysyl-tRNA synthetase class 2
MEIDEGFVTCMEHGMPPMSGLGLGIDRLVCFLADQPTLRDIIFFPLMK